MKFLKNVVVTLLMSAFLVISASAENMYTEVDLQRYENNIGFLNEIGVMEYSDNITRTVTRGEFTKILTFLSGIDSYKSENAGFIDVTDSTKYADYINNIYALGVMNGYGGGLFGPEDTLTYEQAIYGLVKILGYGEVIENNFAAYSSQALQLGLCEKTYGNGNYPITYGSLAMMVMNTLEANVLEYDMNDQSLSQSEETLIEKVFGLEKYSGVVTATAVTSLNKAAGSGKQSIEINNEVYYCERPFDDYLGYNVDYYVDGENEVVYFSKHLTRNEELVINAEQLIEYSDRTYTYENENGRRKTEKIPVGCSVIYNGRAITGEADIDMYVKNGELVFIDNDNDSHWDVLKITDIKAMVVGAVNSEEYAINDKFNSGNILNLLKAYENETLVMKNHQGLDCGIDSISEGNVLSIIMSADGYVAEIRVSRTKKNGKIEQYNADKKIKVDGEEFLLREGELAGDIEYDGNGTLYVDVFGYGIYFERTSTGLNYGYVTKVFSEPPHETYGIKIYDFSAATMKTLYFNKKVVVDGVKQSDSAKIIETLVDGETTIPQIMGYSLNSSGKINKIDTLEYKSGKEDEGTLRLHTTQNSGVGYRSEMSCFRDGKTFVNASTKFVKIPTGDEGLSEDDFMNFTASDLSNDGQYKFTSYKTGANELSADYVLLNSMDNLTIFGVVKDVVSTINDDDEDIYEVELYTQSGGEMTVYAEPDYIENAPAYKGSGSYKIGKGDVISYLSVTDSTNRNKIQDAQIIFDYDENGNSCYLGGSNPYINWGSAGVNFYCGNVYSREGNLIGMTDDDLTGYVPEYTTDQLQLMSLDRGVVFKMQEGKTNEVVVGKASEIVDYGSVGSENSKIFVYLSSLVVRFIYIYE